MIAALQRNPKQFPKKRGELGGCRAAEIVFADGVAWRAVFALDESTRTVFWLSLDAHDAAYANARRRR